MDTPAPWRAPERAVEEPRPEGFARGGIGSADRAVAVGRRAVYLWDDEKAKKKMEALAAQKGDCAGSGCRGEDEGTMLKPM